MTLSITLASVLRRIEAENAENPIWIVGPETGEFLLKLVRIFRPLSVLEIGTSVGYSALWLAAGLKMNFDENGQSSKLRTLESHKERGERAKINVADSGLGEFILLLNGHAPEFFEVSDGAEQANTDVALEAIDMLFLDATKHQTPDFLKALIKYMKSGSVLIVDNIHSHRFGVMENFLTQMHEDEKWHTFEVPIGAGLLVAIYEAKG